MSVLIRGMEMPQACGECPFQASRWTGDFCSAGQFMIGMDCDPRDKHEKCPLVEIKTPHGRLIDADANICVLENCMEAAESAFDRSYYSFAGQIMKVCPTIIDPEGGEADGN